VSAGVFQGNTVADRFETRAQRKITGNGQELNIFAVGNQSEDYTLAGIGSLMLKLP